MHPDIWSDAPAAGQMTELRLLRHMCMLPRHWLLRSQTPGFSMREKPGCFGDSACLSAAGGGKMISKDEANLDAHRFAFPPSLFQGPAFPPKVSACFLEDVVSLGIVGTPS